jgi:glycosyltransferase involved in cell wall biosynthesis
VKVLVVTNMYPSANSPAFGIFVHDQVLALRSAGAEIDVLFVNGRASTWNYIRAFPRFWRALRRRHYDLIHAHYVLTGLIARAQWGKKVVLTHHGPELLGHPWWQTVLAHLVTPFFDEVIYVSEETRQALRDRDGWVIPCGVDVDQFTPQPRREARDSLDLPQDRPLVLWAGEHWRPEKRFDLVERAMAEVKHRLPSAELVLLTKKPHDVVPTYMSACDALILTSDAEGSPMVIKEAMACNLPVVSVRVGDVPEVISGTAGCAIAERDPADIAEKLVDVLRSPRRTDGRLRLGRYSHQRIAADIAHVYTCAVGRNGVRHAEA